MRSGVALDAIISKVAARRVTESDWLQAHDDRIRAEALAPVLALADEWEREAARIRGLLGPDPDGDYSASVASTLGDIEAAEACAAALRVAAGTPTHHTTEEDT